MAPRIPAKLYLVLIIHRIPKQKQAFRAALPYPRSVSMQLLSATPCELIEQRVPNVSESPPHDLLLIPAERSHSEGLFAQLAEPHDLTAGDIKHKVQALPVTSNLPKHAALAATSGMKSSLNGAQAPGAPES